MQTKFSLNDKVQINYRDETVIGIITEINEREFKVVSLTNIDLGWFPNDVGSYVQLYTQDVDEVQQSLETEDTLIGGTLD